MKKSWLIRTAFLLVFAPLIYYFLLTTGTINFLSQLPELFAPAPWPPAISLDLENNAACVPMNSAERMQEMDALQILRDFPGSRIYFAAVDFFGESQYREAMDVAPGQEPDPPGRWHTICRDDEIDAAIASTVVQQGMFNWYLLSSNELHLASMLGPRDPSIVTGVGRDAFGPQVGSPDTRPLARLVLAQFGSLAAPWSDQAFAAMSANDIAGTAAARVAIVTNHPMALQKASELISNILTEHPYGAIGTDDSARIFELANAMALAGPQAQPYIGPLVNASHRSVRVWFWDDEYFFSMPPTFLCQPLSVIGGNEAAKVLQQPWCSSQKDRF